MGLEQPWGWSSLRLMLDTQEGQAFGDGWTAEKTDPPSMT